MEARYQGHSCFEVRRAHPAALATASGEALAEPGRARGCPYLSLLPATAAGSGSGWLRDERQLGIRGVWKD